MSSRPPRDQMVDKVVAAVYGRSSDGDVGPASAVKAASATWRHVDPIRKTALECAVAAWPDIGTREEATTGILAVAQRFERYLTGEEANGDPGDFSTERMSTEGGR